jgi:hypothetical protein
MKNSSSRRGDQPVSESGPAVETRLRAEPSPTIAGLPGKPWQPPYQTVDVLRARPQPSPLVRRAFDPIGQGWAGTRHVVEQELWMELALETSETAARTLPRKPVRKKAARANVPPPLPVPVNKSPDLKSPDSAATVPPPKVAPVPLPETEVAPPRWNNPVSARAQARRIELIPSAPPLPRILFTGDAPPPGFDPGILTGSSFGHAATTQSAGEACEAGESGVEVTTSLALSRSPAVAPAVHLPDESGQVWLSARDPFTVVAHWDRQEVPAEAPEKEWGRGRWWMRLHAESADGPVITERPATEVAGTVLLPVIESGRPYVAELGYDSHRSGWHGVAISHPVPTPPDRPVVVERKERPVIWGTIAPWDGEPGAGRSVGYVPAALPPRTEGAQGFPAGPVSEGDCVSKEEWVEECSEEWVDQGTSEGPLRWSWRAWLGEVMESSGAVVGESGPDELEQPTRRSRVLRKGSSLLEAGLWDLAGAGGVASDALAAAMPAQVRRSFWFRINAEVILHGSTEPDARVTIAGRPVALRPDGSFSFRFAFPDGDYGLPVSATSADGVERRQASVRFQRGTVLDGEVGEHPMMPAWDADLNEWGSSGA